MSPENGVMERATIIDEAEVITGHILSNYRAEHDPEIDRTDLNYVPAEAYDELPLTNTRVQKVVPLVRPKDSKKDLPLTRAAAETTYAARLALEDIVHDRDDRLVVVIGPCSIHDPEAALEYGKWIVGMRDKHASDLEIVMRAYVEKPRTTIGWKGLWNQPKIYEETNLSLGAVSSRLLYLNLTGMGVPTANEFIDPRAIQHIDDLYSLGAIGARDVLSTRGRNLLSAMSAPGLAKNGPDGHPISAVEAAYTAAMPHTFSGADPDTGGEAQITSSGNPSIVVVLRGGTATGPNYASEFVQETRQLQRERGVVEAVGVDASHANSNKDYTRQIEVVRDMRSQLVLGELALKLVMIESNLVAGKQDHEEMKRLGRELVRGKSITDGCVDLEVSENMLELLADGVRLRRKLVSSLRA